MLSKQRKCRKVEKWKISTNEKADFKKLPLNVQYCRKSGRKIDLKSSKYSFCEIDLNEWIQAWRVFFSLLFQVLMNTMNRASTEKDQLDQSSSGRQSEKRLKFY